MSTKYQYTISTQTANGKVNGNQLAYEIGVALPPPAPAIDPADGINTDIEPDKLDIYMSAALDAGQQATLTATVAAHQGTGYVATMQGTLPLVNGEQAVTSDLAWEVIEGVKTTPGFFSDDLNQIIARVVGEHRGDGGQLSIMETVDGEGTEEKTSPPFDFPDTGGAWQTFKVDSNIPPRAGLRNLYRTDCRLNGAASLELRYTTISMIKVVVT